MRVVLKTYLIHNRKSLVWSSETYTYLDKELLHMVAIQLERQNKWHLHLKAVDWYTHDFSVGSLSHMSQNKPPNLSTLSILRQLELLSNNKRVYRQLFSW